mmetsp:Transcript_119329/g.178275  ORF Transcript_119329/g.178275 Transcript_119329/m.178275 type:complete len:124 (+) Transcript_119329:727-1098(+)
MGSMPSTKDVDDKEEEEDEEEDASSGSGCCLCCCSSGAAVMPSFRFSASKSCNSLCSEYCAITSPATHKFKHKKELEATGWCSIQCFILEKKRLEQNWPWGLKILALALMLMVYVCVDGYGTL